MPPDRAPTQQPDQRTPAEALDQLYAIYLVAKGLNHWATRGPKAPAATLQSVQFLPTHFVYTFFAFNSVYSTADWHASQRAGRLVPHPPTTLTADGRRRKLRELDQIDALTRFIAIAQGDAALPRVASTLRSHAATLSRLLPPSERDLDQAGWLDDIVPAPGGRSGVSHEESQKAGSDWRTLLTPHSRTPVASFCQLVEFVYTVRNRTFHGTKPLDLIEEPRQQRRFAAYTAVLLTTLELFFASAAPCFQWTNGVYE